MAEDNTILQVYKKLRSKKDYAIGKVSEEVHTKLVDRTRDAIETRVNTYFVGITKTDEEKIAKAALVKTFLQRKIQHSMYIMVWLAKATKNIK